MDKNKVIKERMILVAMPLSFNKCVGYDKSKSVLNRAIPLPDELVSVVGRILANTISKRSSREGFDLDINSVRDEFVKKCMDELFYMNEKTDNPRYIKDMFINSMGGLNGTLNMIWDRMYKITESVVTESGMYDKMKDELKDVI